MTGTRILLDMGNGSLGALQRHTDIYDIDGVVLSHLHVDHFIDLCSYYVALKYRPRRSAAVSRCGGPPDTSQRLVTAYGLTPGSDMAGELDVRTIEPCFTDRPVPDHDHADASSGRGQRDPGRGRGPLDRVLGGHRAESGNSRSSRRAPIWPCSRRRSSPAATIPPICT